MDFVETEGDTIDAAIENALKILGVGRDKVTVEIISEGRKGIFGFGAQKARDSRRAAGNRRSSIEMTAEPEAGRRGAGCTAVEASAIAEKAKAAYWRNFQFNGSQSDGDDRKPANGDETILEVRADNSGLLIGRKGQTLEALQYLVIRIAGERPGSEGPHIVIDIENYRERRRKSLEDMALRMGEKAKRQRKTVTVDALSAADRRIIHAALQDDPWVTTQSLGQGSYRRLLIIPEGDRRKRKTTRAGRKTAAPVPSERPVKRRQLRADRG